MNQTYQITLGTGELVLDLDDLIGIVQQLDAIVQGWGMEFSYLPQQEEVLWETPRHSEATLDTLVKKIKES